MVQSTAIPGGPDEPAHDEPAVEPRAATRPIAGQRERERIEQEERQRQQHEADHRVVQEHREREQSDASQQPAAAARKRPPLDDGLSMVEKAKRGAAAGTAPQPSQAQLDEDKARALSNEDPATERRDMQPGTPGSYRTR